MSQKIIKFFLRELKTIRLICRNDECGAVTELPVAKMNDQATAPMNCPVCHRHIQNSGGTNYLHRLAQAMEGINAQSKQLDVEFVLEDPC